MDLLNQITMQQSVATEIVYTMRREWEEQVVNKGPLILAR